MACDQLRIGSLVIVAAGAGALVQCGNRGAQQSRDASVTTSSAPDVGNQGSGLNSTTPVPQGTSSSRELAFPSGAWMIARVGRLRTAFERVEGLSSLVNQVRVRSGFEPASVLMDPQNGFDLAFFGNPSSPGSYAIGMDGPPMVELASRVGPGYRFTTGSNGRQRFESTTDPQGQHCQAENGATPNTSRIVCASNVAILETSYNYLSQQAVQAPVPANQVLVKLEVNTLRTTPDFQSVTNNLSQSRTQLTNLLTSSTDGPLSDPAFRQAALALTNELFDSAFSALTDTSRVEFTMDFNATDATVQFIVGMQRVQGTFLRAFFDFLHTPPATVSAEIVSHLAPSAQYYSSGSLNYAGLLPVARPLLQLIDLALRQPNPFSADRQEIVDALGNAVSTEPYVSVTASGVEPGSTQSTVEVTELRHPAVEDVARLRRVGRLLLLPSVTQLIQQMSPTFPPMSQLFVDLPATTLPSGSVGVHVNLVELLRMFPSPQQQGQVRDLEILMVPEGNRLTAIVGNNATTLWNQHSRNTTAGILPSLLSLPNGGFVAAIDLRRMLEADPDTAQSRGLGTVMTQLSSANNSGPSNTVLRIWTEPTTPSGGYQFNAQLRMTNPTLRAILMGFTREQR